MVLLLADSQLSPSLSWGSTRYLVWSLSASEYFCSSSDLESSSCQKLVAYLFDMVLIQNFPLWSDFLHHWQSLCQSDQHVVANNSFCGTCYIFSRGRTLMYIVLWDFHSLGTGTFCVVSDFFLWFLTILKSVSTAPLVYVIFSSVVYISAARIIPMSLSSVNALICFLTSQLFIPVTNMQKISSLFNTH